MNNVVAPSLELAWLILLRDVITNGKEIKSRIGGCKELLNYSIEIINPLKRYVFDENRKLNFAYCFAEFGWMVAADNFVKDISLFNDNMNKYSDNGVTLDGAYGTRIVDAWGMAAYKLMNEENSRQVVIPIYSISDVKMRTKDLPCTLSFQFIKRDNRLNMIVNMRSNDIWLGAPYDIFTFTSLQELMANQIGCKVGSYFHNVGSIHLYEEHYEKAINTVKNFQNYKSIELLRMDETFTIQKIRAIWYGLINGLSERKLFNDNYSDMFGIIANSNVSSYEKIFRTILLAYLAKKYYCTNVEDKKAIGTYIEELLFENELYDYNFMFSRFLK